MCLNYTFFIKSVKMENEGIITRTYFLTNKNVSEIRIRNGHLWFVSNERHLFYCNLNSKPLKVQEFQNSEVDFYSVSPDGEYCFAHTTKKYFMLYAGAELKFLELKNIPSIYVATSTSWLYKRGCKKPYLFFGTNSKLICYLNLNTKVIVCSFLALVDVVFRGPIDGLFITQFNDDRFGVMVSSDSEVYYFVLGVDFFHQKDKSNRKVSFQISPKIRDSVFSENSFFGIINEPLILTFEFNRKQNAPSPAEIMSRQHFFEIQNGTRSFTFFANFMIHFTDDKIYFFDQKSQKYFYSLKISNVDMLEMDSATGDLYSIKGNYINHYQFDSPMKATGFDCLRFWLCYRLLATKKEKEAAEILLQTSIPFDQMVKFARNESNYFRLNLFKEYINLINPIYKLQRVAIAQFALELYIRIQSKEEKPNIKEFVSWFKKLKKDGLLVESAVEKLCKNYGWEEPLLEILEPPSLFNVKMENNKIDEAQTVLSKIKKPEDFSNNALRIYKQNTELVVNIIRENPELIERKIIPILSTKVFMDQIIDFFKNHTLKYQWLRHLYAIQLSKCNFQNEEIIDDLVKNFCYNSLFTVSDVEFAVRCLIDEKKFKQAALALIEKGEYIYAAGVLSHGDPEKAFDLIPTDISIDVRRRCVLRILRSMNRKDAEKLAQKLLNSSSGVDIITILEYLPDNTKIAELRKIIPVYIDKNKKIAEEQNQIKEDALKGINDSNELAKIRKDQVINLPNMQLCSRCGKRLFTETGIVFPCMHAFHVDCLQVFNQDKEKCLDCPICGFSSVRMIDQPFEPDWDCRNDPWTTDENELRRLIS